MALTQLGKVALELVYVGLFEAPVEILIVKLLCLLLGPVRLSLLPGVVVVETAGNAANYGRSLFAQPDCSQ